MHALQVIVEVVLGLAAYVVIGAVVMGGLLWLVFSVADFRRRHIARHRRDRRKGYVHCAQVIDIRSAGAAPTARRTTHRR